MTKTTMTLGGTPEQMFRNERPEVVALIPCWDRVPDEGPGTCYEEIARGRKTVREGVWTMDRAMVVHTDYAESWLRHAWMEERAYDRPLVAWAETMGLVVEHIVVRECRA